MFSFSKSFSAIRVLVLLGSLSVTGLLALQAYWVRQAFNNEEKQFRQSVYLALDKVARQLAVINQTTLPNATVVQQLGGNYFVVNINAQIDANLLDHYLRVELGKQHLNTDFEYGIYDCSTDKVMYGGYVSAQESVGALDNQGTYVPMVRTDLPKYDKFPYYFSVRFPGKVSYLVSELDLWVFSTGIIAVVVLFFGYALFIIIKQKRLSEVQRDFINNMTHEFKTPISTISLAAQVVSQPNTVAQPERLVKYGRIIEQETLRLNGLVERVLQVARVDKQGLKLTPGEVNLNELLTEVATTIDVQSRSPHGYLVLDLPPETVLVKADRLHLCNVLYNLLDNAMKYNQRPPQLRLRLQPLGNKVMLQVQDNGIGIPAKYQSQVFDRFFRVPTGNVHNVKGFGIGLSYVKLVTSTHKWALHLLSFPGQGTTFTLSMPYTTA